MTSSLRNAGRLYYEVVPGVRYIHTIHTSSAWSGILLAFREANDANSFRVVGHLLCERPMAYILRGRACTHAYAPCRSCGVCITYVPQQIMNKRVLLRTTAVGRKGGRGIGRGGKGRRVSKGLEGVEISLLLLLP